MARWWSLHEDLHATTQVLAELAWKPRVATQVPAQLVGLELHANGGGVLVDGGLAVAPLMSSTRALPGARQGSCRGIAVVPGKALAGGLVDPLG